MANKRHKSPIGERPQVFRPSEYIDEESTIDPLPLFPGIVRQLRGPTNAMVLTYLEMVHPAPQDSNGAYLTLPVTIDCDCAARDLQISRRTLHIALHCLATWFLTEERRGRAERAGRAFINESHSQQGTIKPYSIVGPSVIRLPHIVLKIKRNWPRINAIFHTAGLDDLQYQRFSSDLSANPLTTEMAIYAPSLSLPAILQRVMPNWGDRRVERWDRWRRLEGREPTNLRRMRQATSSLDVVTPRE
jgi:hypothetical protein